MLARVEPEELAKSIKRLVGWAEEHAPKPEPEIRVRLRAHFAREPGELPVVSRALEAWDRPNLQVALEAWLEGKQVEIIGISVMEGYRAGLAELVRGGTWGSQAQLGGVEHVTVPLGGDETMRA